MTTVSSHRAAILLFALACAAPHVSAQVPRAGVEFTIADSTVRAILGSDLAATETQLAQMVAARLDTIVGFVRFVSGAQGNYGLRFTIDRRDPRLPADLDELGVRARLIHPDEDSTVYWLTLREAGDYTRIAGREGLVRDIERLIRSANYAPIDGLLAYVPISDEAFPRNTPAGWVLPLKAEAVCLRDSTHLRVANRERRNDIIQTHHYAVLVRGAIDPQSSVPDERYKGGLFGESPGAIRLGDVIGVFVTMPVRMRHCRLEPASPITDGGVS